MTDNNAGSKSAYGSYVQLGTFDEQDKTAKEDNTILHTHPRRRFLITKRDIIIVIVVLLIAFIIITTTLSLGLPKIREKKSKYYDISFPVSSSPIQIFQRAAVITDGIPCAAIGKQILQNGGSAVDSAVATLFCNGVVNPQSMGLGGGFLMTIFNKEQGIAEVIDARETAPLEATKYMFNGSSLLSQEGGLSVAVPGELRGYELAHQKYGKLNWSELVQPSVKLCEEGFEVSEHLSKYLNTYREKIVADPSLKEEFYNNVTGDVYKTHEILKRPILGNTLKVIAEHGADALYSGNLTQSLVDDIRSCGGIISEEDLQQYKALHKSAVTVELKDELETRVLHTAPPPGSGLILALILNILNGYNFTSEDMNSIDSAVLTYHRIVEAFKFSFAYRTRLGDSTYVNNTELLENLKSAEFAETLRKKISDTRTNEPNYYEPVLDETESHGTAQVSVWADNGDAVSATSTVNTYFGSLCRSPSTGIILNNAMDDFASPNITNYFGIPPAPANYIMPKKRPLSSMCPSILVNKENEVHMVMGGAGGSRIITAIAQAMIRVLWLGEDIKKATDAPRLHHQLFPNEIEYETDFPQIYRDKLKKYGHDIQLSSENSVVLGIVKEKGTLQANVDYRKGGSADGF